METITEANTESDTVTVSDSVRSKALARLENKRNITESGCWEWTGYVEKVGYGRTSYMNVRQYVHRLSYMLHNGPIGEALHIDHLCRNKICFNPDHLEAVTPKENIRRAVYKGYCNKHQKEFLKTGHKWCESCYKESRAEFYRKKVECDLCDKVITATNIKRHHKNIHGESRRERGLPIRVRIESASSKSDTGCWELNTKLNPQGYGYLWVEGRKESVHRASYEAFIGPISEGMTIDHICRNTSCVNPNHLEQVTQSENNARK